MEVITDYIDDQGLLYFDFYETDDPDEQGRSVAVLDTWTGLYVERDLDVCQLPIIREAYQELRAIYPDRRKEILEYLKTKDNVRI